MIPLGSEPEKGIRKSVGPKAPSKARSIALRGQTLIKKRQRLVQSEGIVHAIAVSSLDLHTGGALLFLRAEIFKY